ncbi:MAG: Gfo/Idh/MocA family oxidoreductase, partial [Bacilli bacterium]
MKYKTVAIIGLGGRGRYAYGNYILARQDEIRCLAIIEPDEEKRTIFALEHNIPLEHCFSNEDDFLKEAKFVDAIIIAHYDHQHFKTALKMI